ncbi:MAG: hypothetical protein KF788_03625 [Piscinibacter sp.]|nr:hypothetical protein [Piscinibacter sp.]
MRTSRPAAAGGAVLALLLAACASTQIDAQWSDPQRPPNLLRSARVMIACEAPDLVLKRICLDQLSSEVVARGGQPVPAPEGLPAGTSSEPHLAAARSAGARAIWTHAVTVASAGATPGFSIGLGAFGLGGGSVRGGVGVSAPLGGGQPTYGFALNGRVTEVRSGRVVWTAKASTPPSSDAGAQLGELTRSIFGAADKAQLF